MAGDRLVGSVTEAGQLLGVSRAFAYELAARGELTTIRLGRRVLVPKVVLLAMVGPSFTVLRCFRSGPAVLTQGVPRNYAASCGPHAGPGLSNTIGQPPNMAMCLMSGFCLRIQYSSISALATGNSGSSATSPKYPRDLTMESTYWSG
jgi:excisionase family DNA binding protein